MLGMHRSGTSAVTRILALLGASLGDERDLIPPAPDNPRGFWENRPLVLVDDRLLGLHGGTWQAPPELPDDWHEHPTVRALRMSAGAVFDRLAVAGTDVVAWKDPRACLLQAFWQPILRSRTDDLRHLHVVRDPGAVVGSLSRRDGLTPEHAARLWVRHVRDACAAAPDALVVEQVALSSDLEHTVGSIATATGLPEPTGATWDEIVAFVDPGLQASRGHRAPEGAWVDLADTMYRALRDGATAAEAVALADRGAPPVPGTGSEQPTLALVGTHAPAPGILAAGVDGDRVAVLAAPTPVDRYALAANAWPLRTMAPRLVPRVLRPGTVWCVDDDALPSLVDGIVDHVPTTRLLVTDDMELTTPADGIIRVADPGPDVAAATRRPVLAAGPPRIGAVGPVASRPGTVSIVLPVHGAWALTAACLDQLATNTDHPLEVVVVDDASPDDTAARLRERDDVDRVVHLDVNVGFARAVNEGIRATTGEYVCILNNDTEVTAGWLGPLLDALQVPGTALAGPRTNRISGPQAIPGAPGFDVLGSSPLHAWAQAWRHDRQDIAWATGRLVGFCLIGRRALFETLGGLDEGVGRGNFEDDELCARVRNHALTCRVAERSIVLHHGSATFGHDRGAYLAAMLAGARHTFGRLRLDGPTATAVVLARDRPDAAARTAMSALPLTEAVQIWWPGACPPRYDAIPLPARIDVRRVDWQDDERVRDALSTIPTPRLLVLGEGETLVADDLALARHELEQDLHDALGHPAETRLVPVAPEAVSRVGQPSPRLLQHLTLSVDRVPVS